jgi:hypothetical protein
MEFAQAETFSGEGKAVTSERSRSGEIAAARLEALIRRPAKRLAGSQRAKRTALPNAMLSTVHAGDELSCRLTRMVGILA